MQRVNLSIVHWGSPYVQSIYWLDLMTSRFRRCQAVTNTHSAVQATAVRLYVHATVVRSVAPPLTPTQTGIEDVCTVHIHKGSLCLWYRHPNYNELNNYRLDFKTIYWQANLILTWEIQCEEPGHSSEKSIPTPKYPHSISTK